AWAGASEWARWDASAPPRDSRISPRRGRTSARGSPGGGPCPPGSWPGAGGAGLVAGRCRACAGRLGGLEQLGELGDAAAVYRGLTVLVQPSRQESFSLVLLEAM